MRSASRITGASNAVTSSACAAPSAGPASALAALPAAPASALAARDSSHCKRVSAATMWIGCRPLNDGRYARTMSRSSVASRHFMRRAVSCGGAMLRRKCVSKRLPGLMRPLETAAAAAGDSCSRLPLRLRGGLGCEEDAEEACRRPAGGAAYRAGCSCAPSTTAAASASCCCKVRCAHRSGLLACHACCACRPCGRPRACMPVAPVAHMHGMLLELLKLPHVPVLPVVAAPAAAAAGAVAAPCAAAPGAAGRAAATAAAVAV
eukprot:357079-Chlamydomonas_euryale.AAC.3